MNELINAWRTWREQRDTVSLLMVLASMAQLAFAAVWFVVSSYLEMVRVGTVTHERVTKSLRPTPIAHLYLTPVRRVVWRRDNTHCLGYTTARSVRDRERELTRWAWGDCNTLTWSVGENHGVYPRASRVEWEIVESEAAATIRAHLARAPRRAVLIIGTPGTGKTTAARTAARGRRAVDVRLQAGVSEADLRWELQALGADVLLLDDADRDALDTRMFDALRDLAPQLIVTANDLSRLDPALLRPGRFDVIVRMDTSDREAIARLSLGDERVAHLPIAYVVEYAKLRAAGLGADEAADDVLAHYQIATGQHA